MLKFQEITLLQSTTNWFQVNEEIRKKLSTTKGYNVAHSYTDCYDNLVKLVSNKLIIYI